MLQPHVRYASNNNLSLTMRCRAKDKKDVTRKFNTRSALLDQLDKTNPKSENQELQTPAKSSDQAKSFRLKNN